MEFSKGRGRKDVSMDYLMGDLYINKSAEGL